MQGIMGAEVDLMNLYRKAEENVDKPQKRPCSEVIVQQFRGQHTLMAWNDPSAAQEVAC